MLILGWFSKWREFYLKAFYPSLHNWKLTWKIGMLRFFLISVFRFSFSHNGGLVQTTPKRSMLKDQETGVIDEFPLGMNTLWIHYGYFINACISCDFLLERFELLAKLVLIKCICCKQYLLYRFHIWLRRHRHLLKTFE